MKKYIQGKYNPKYPKKYIGDIDNIIYRSNLERRFFYRCDNNINIIEWGSEEIVIPYISDFDNKPHNYFVDLYLKVKTKNNEIKKFIIEIKPLKFTKKPRLPKSGRKTKGYLFECKNYIINTSKWKYAIDFAKKNSMEFMILTEKDLK